MTALRWRASTQAVALTLAVAVSVSLAVVTRSLELLALGVPAVWALLTVTRTAEPQAVSVDTGPREVRGREGEPMQLALMVRTAEPVGALRAELALPPELIGEARDQVSGAAHLELRSEVLPARWGRHRIGPLRIDLLAAGGLRAATVDVRLPVEGLVLPQPQQIRASSAPPLLPDRAGEHVTRAAGHGVEPFAVRPFATGDAVRRVNWRVSSRRGSLHVTVGAAERAVELVLVVDALSDVGGPAETSLDRAVRSAAGLAVRWLRDRDRVGLVVLGGALRWLTPATGRVQQQRVAEAVLWSWPPPGEVPPEVARVPRAALPPGAVVVVFSPLLDERALEAVAALRERTRHVLVVDVLRDAAPAVDRKDATGQLAARLWRLERDALVTQLARSGAPVLQPGLGDLDRLVALALRSAR